MSMETLETLGGNTNSPKVKEKRDNQLKKWVFTLNNYTEQDILEILETCETICEKYGFQTELGAGDDDNVGQHHLQGAMWLSKPMRWSEFKWKCKPHFEKMKSDAGSNDYVQKEYTFTGRRWNKGLKPPKKPLKLITTLRPWQKKVEDLVLTEPDDRKVYWFWESTGNVGKSALVKYLVSRYGCLFCNGGKGSDLINLIFNQDMDATTCVIWDLPRENKGFISSSTVEAVKNGMVCNTKYETGVKLFNAPHVIIFSNYPPENVEELSKDRWVVEEIIQ